MKEAVEDGIVDAVAVEPTKDKRSLFEFMVASLVDRRRRETWVSR